MYTHILFK